MIVMFNKPGQLANRLIAFGHFLANAIEYQYTLVNPTFDEYRPLLPATRKSGYQGLPVRMSVPVPLNFKQLRFMLRAWRKFNKRSPWHEFEAIQHIDTYQDINNPEFGRRAASKVVFTDGWRYRDPANVIKHGDTLRAFFAPDQTVLDAIHQHIDRDAHPGATVVGVHLRKRDYIRWLGGKHYYSNQQYADQMRHLQEQLEAEGQTVRFMLCSDEAIDMKDFAAFRAITGPGTVMEDLYGLSQCDLLMGPPSTFSTWASFFGQTPLYHIMDPEEPVDRERFHVREKLMA